MGFLNALINVASAATKVVLTPVAAVVDVGAKVVTGENPGLAEGTLSSAVEDLEEIPDELFED